MPVFFPKEPKWKGEITAVLDLQLSHDRHEFNTTYVNSLEMKENSKRADKMWETGNSNIDSYETLENSKSVIELVEVNHAERKDAELRNISDSLKFRL